MCVCVCVRMCECVFVCVCVKERFIHTQVLGPVFIGKIAYEAIFRIFIRDAEYINGNRFLR